MFTFTPKKAKLNTYTGNTITYNSAYIYTIHYASTATRSSIDFNVFS